MQNVFERVENEPIILVDEWQAQPEDEIFKHTKGALVLPVSNFYGIKDNTKMLDYFILSTKRCYNSDKVRFHICQYLNYFEKYYDPEHELLAIYFKIKYLIDYHPEYNEQALAWDLENNILNGIIFHKARLMNSANYSLSLNYRNTKNPGLQYTDKHGAILMEISLLMNMMIPILTHFVFIKKLPNTKFFLLKMFEMVFNKYDSVDMISKLYETAISTVNKNKDAHPILWGMQNIRSRSATTHSIATVGNIILQIVPKYTYDKHIIHFNYKSILKNLSYQVIDITYEYALISLSSSKRDEDNNSEFDKFEAHLTKQDESLYIQNKVNCEETMKLIELEYGPFDEGEIKFYIKELTRDNRMIINQFQKDMVFNLFYRYFGDPQSIKAINQKDYIKLIIATKKILEVNKMVVLPYIISSKIEKVVNRQNINKKELTKLEMSQYYPMIKEKYHNEKIEKNILGVIATILSSKFRIIDYHNPDLNGQLIDIMPEFVCEEVLMFINMI